MSARLRCPACPYIKALQLRPSLAHLDKEKEQSAARKKQDGGEEEDQKQPELLQLTVQVRHVSSSPPLQAGCAGATPAVHARRRTPRRSAPARAEARAAGAAARDVPRACVGLPACR